MCDTSTVTVCMWFTMDKSDAWCIKMMSLKHCVAIMQYRWGVSNYVRRGEIKKKGKKGKY